MPTVTRRALLGTGVVVVVVSLSTGSAEPWKR